MAISEKKVLGRGLEALIPTGLADSKIGSHITHVGIDKIIPNPYQPRKHFNSDKLQELAESIREHGLIQPIVVAHSDEGYQIVAGERRWRAAKQAGLESIPVIIKDLAPQE